MGTSPDISEKRIEEARRAILTLPANFEATLENELPALTRYHLELTKRSNGGKPGWLITSPSDVPLATKIQETYRADIFARLHDARPKVLLHSAQEIAGTHQVAPQLAFLAEVCTVPTRLQVRWWCQSTSGRFIHYDNPVATHLQTSFRGAEDDDSVRHFSKTPLFSSAAFCEDIERIKMHGAQLAIGHGPPSHIVSLIIAELARWSSAKNPFQTSSVSSLQVDQSTTQDAVITARTTSLGNFTVRAVLRDWGECGVSAEQFEKVLPILPA